MLETVLEQALSLFSDKDLSQSQRLLHGRGRCYAGYEQLSIDWFSPVLLITQYKANNEISIKNLVKGIKSYFSKHFPTHEIGCIVFHDRSVDRLSVEILEGELPEKCFAIERIHENKIRFHIDFHFQNIGFFLDARNARKYLYEISQGKKVLNLFAFTCAFSVSALSGGASSVVNLDMGKGVLQRGELNHELNNLDKRSATYVKSDVFKAWKKLHKYGRYDVIVIDPPSFQKGSFNAEKDYARIVSQLGKLLMPQAIIVACLNSPFLGETFLDELFLQAELNSGIHGCSKLSRLENPKAFKDENPDAGLKVVVYTYQRLES